MSRQPPRRMLPIPDGDAPKSGRPPPPLPADDTGTPPPVPGRRLPPPVPPPESDRHSDSSYESDSDFDADSEESYEKMREKLSPPAIPNRGYRQRDDFPSPPSTPRSVITPPPGRSLDTSPRPPPPSRNLPTLPTVPSGRRGPPQVPTKDEPEEVYDDGETGEIYEDDFAEPEDVYDDGEVGEEEYHEPEIDKPPPLPAAPRRDLPPPPPQSSRPPPPLPEPVQDVYEVEPEPDPVPKIPNRPLMNAPQETYELDEEFEQENYDEFSVEEEPAEVYDEFDQGEPCEVYEAVNDSPNPALPGRPVPPPPPSIPSHSKPTPPPPMSKATQPKPTPKPSGGGPMGIDLSAITNIKLKKVGVPLEDRPKPPDSDKIYNEEGGVKSAFEKFKQKEPVAQMDFRSILSKTKNNVPQREFGNKSVEKTLPPTPLKPPVNKWGQIRAQCDIDRPEPPPAVSKSLPPVPHKPSEVEPTSSHPAFSLPGRQRHPENEVLHADLPAPSVRLSPLPDPIPRKEALIPPKEPPPNLTPPIPATRRSPSPSKESPPLPPPVKSDKPPPVPYSQVKPTSTVTNGARMGIQEDKPPSEDEDDTDDIYDDAFSNRDPLLGEPWYFKSLKDRKTGDRLLRKVGKDGTFLIRESTKQGHVQPYTMMVLYQNNIYNLKVRVRPDGKMALGEEKPDEMAFMDVQKLVKYHRETEVILVGNTGQHKTLLKQSPPQNAM
uniref:Leucine-rich repeat extensin-like protein 5 isoform X3 n=1 Tax=Crassostrea virginica TaxID=6565 RepID=A0A8B8ERV3_CRAVI|nr:leucine-rich repeat extensin-like protein 5 isoform X3 [Crassostrea virginica]